MLLVIIVDTFMLFIKMYNYRGDQMNLIREIVYSVYAQAFHGLRRDAIYFFASVSMCTRKDRGNVLIAITSS